MTRSELISLVREVMSELDEANVTGGTATFTPGTGAQYATPFAFGKDKRASKALKRIGYKNVKKKKRPYSTKLIDYLQNENNNSN
jgi:hypothetical protein|tara:strand:- start:175 stop:429 length:255 start_codon:yes stop_codon:yes gene_type:complete